MLGADHDNIYLQDTEFPGIVARPIGSFKGSSDYHYQTLRCNVDLLKLIQLGITVCDEHGNLPPEVCTWQFNFRFSLNNDMCAPESLDLLNKAGLDFDQHEKMGIDVEHFGELLITSGLAIFDDVKWVSFHRCVSTPDALASSFSRRRWLTTNATQISNSGYDFGYLLKVVTAEPLPAQEADFFERLRIWFPCIYDIKYLMRSCKTLKGGLQDVADDLQVARIGQQHQAGSDSLLTAFTFFKMRKKYFDGQIDDSKYLGCLYGFSAAANRPVEGGNATDASQVYGTTSSSLGSHATSSATATPTKMSSGNPFTKTLIGAAGSS